MLFTTLRLRDLLGQGIGIGIERRQRKPSGPPTWSYIGTNVVDLTVVSRNPPQGCISPGSDGPEGRYPGLVLYSH